MTDSKITEANFPVSPVLIPDVQHVTAVGPMMLAHPTFEEQRSGDPMHAAALTIPGRMFEAIKRQILADLGPEWCVLEETIGGVRVY